jgi:putative hemolysin
MHRPNKKKFLMAICLSILGVILSSSGRSAVNTPTPQPETRNTAKLANPASVNCSKQGGKLTIQKRGDGGEYGICSFEDNRQCEEWALFRGDCPKGGVKITGYDNPQQIYCAITGGKTLAKPHATCSFKDGMVCDDEALFDGKCQRGGKNSLDSAPSQRLGQ